MSDIPWTRRCESNACIETAAVGDKVHIRSTRTPDQVLIVDRDEWEAFLRGSELAGVDLEAIREHWLASEQGVVVLDGGLPMSFVCSHEDPRYVIEALVTEVERLRSQATFAGAARRPRDRGQKPISGATPPPERRSGVAIRARVADLLPSRAKDLPWTWADEDRNTRTRQCLCCGRPGHYQQMLEDHMAAHGTEGLGIVVENGFVEDGHHRVVAAISLGIDDLPTESGSEAQARWVRDHGHVDWSGRKFGDR
jgi:hypothetical protein